MLLTHTDQLTSERITSDGKTSNKRVILAVLLLLLSRVGSNDRHVRTRRLALCNRHTDQNEEERDDELHYGTFN
jgi:hypothetical protein